MKMFNAALAVCLLLAAGSTLAADPVKTGKPAVTQPMDHSKMDMSQCQMDHSKMDMSHCQMGDSKMDMSHCQMDDSKMEMSHCQMDHSKMDMSHCQMDHEKIAGDAFVKLDTNKDGKLSKAEMAAHFSMLDTDKNASLSPAEFSKVSGM